MKAVYYGAESLANYIKHVNLPAYRIYIAERNGSYSTPIFSSLTASTKTALSDFTLFAENILLGNPTDDTVYYIKFYADPKSTKVQQNETFFAFNKEKDISTGVGSFGGGSMGEIIGLMQTMMPMAKAQAENELLKEKILDMQDEINDEPETSTVNQIISGIAAVLPQLLNNNNGGVQIAGDPATIERSKSLLDKALIILKKHDPELETDLYKLSQIAENNPEQFNMLISMLRNM